MPLRRQEWEPFVAAISRRQSRACPLIRGLVEAPLLGPPLCRLNTTRSVLGWMSQRQVDVTGPGLTPEGIARRQGIARQAGARLASAAFVSWGLDPCSDPEGWMQALAAVVDRVLRLPERLGAHEEFGADLAALLSVKPEAANMSRTPGVAVFIAMARMGVVMLVQG
ncbi:MAG: hypothetical protein ACKO7Z_03795 [Cyanobacteriota bacterium]